MLLIANEKTIQAFTSVSRNQIKPLNEMVEGDLYLPGQAWLAPTELRWATLSFLAQQRLKPFKIMSFLLFKGMPIPQLHNGQIQMSRMWVISIFLSQTPSVYISLWMPSGFWSSRQPSVAISHDGLLWTVVGHLDPDEDCVANKVPELFIESSALHLATGFLPKSGPNGSGSMTSLRLRTISVSQFISNLALVRPAFFNTQVALRTPASLNQDGRAPASTYTSINANRLSKLNFIFFRK